MLAVQRSFEDLGTPLRDVTFVVIDLETTGGSPETCRITEVGAVKVRGGDCLGTLQTLVNPGMAIPPEVTYLTGITEAMVIPAPPIEEVLPSLLEFIGDAVVVGHNVRFDVGFLNASLQRADRPRITNDIVDTCGLARRLVREEVRDCKLGTLARHFRVSHKPTHRALDDALATVEVLHCLLERAGTMGVVGLDDLLALPTVQGHPQLAKLRLLRRLPRAPGVYLFRDRGGRVLYVGKAVDLRRRVRSYFTGDDRRKVGPLLRELHAIDHEQCATELEAALLEVRLIRDLAPRYNRRGKPRDRTMFVKLTLGERFPRLSVVRQARPDDGCLYVGPFASQRAAREVVDAVETAVPIRRCRETPGRTPRSAPCAPAQLGVSVCPCAGAIGEEGYRAIVEQVVAGLTTDPTVLLAPLRRRMEVLARASRFEEAGDVRDRAAALANVLARTRRAEWFRRAERVRLSVGGVEVTLDCDALSTEELLCAASWLDSRARSVTLLSVEGTLASPLPRLPSFVASTRSTRVLTRAGEPPAPAGGPRGGVRAVAS